MFRKTKSGFPGGRPRTKILGCHFPMGGGDGISVFALGKSCQGDTIRYIKGLKIRSYEMSFTKNSVATMRLLIDPLRLELVRLEPEWQHVNDSNAAVLKFSSSGLNQKEIAEKLGISQQAVSKKLRKG